MVLTLETSQEEMVPLKLAATKSLCMATSSNMGMRMILGLLAKA